MPSCTTPALIPSPPAAVHRKRHSDRPSPWPTCLSLLLCRCFPHLSAPCRWPRAVGCRAMDGAARRVGTGQSRHLDPQHRHPRGARRSRRRRLGARLLLPFLRVKKRKSRRSSDYHRKRRSSHSAKLVGTVTTSSRPQRGANPTGAATASSQPPRRTNPTGAVIASSRLQHSANPTDAVTASNHPHPTHAPDKKRPPGGGLQGAWARRGGQAGSRSQTTRVPRSAAAFSTMSP